MGGRGRRRRRPRFRNAALRIVAQGVAGRELFRDPFDYYAFLIVLEDVKERAPFRLTAYCLLPDRVELLIAAGEQGASRIIHRLLLSYAKYYNRRYGLNGHVFARRFDQQPCLETGRLMEMIGEIHRLPVASGLVSDARAWDWSGHRELVGMRRRHLLDATLPLEAERARASKSGQEFLADLILAPKTGKKLRLF